VQAQVDPPNAPPAARPQQSSQPANVALPAPVQGVPAKR
jgi:hypothetical protein